MKLVSIDVETTGVDFKKDKLLSIGLVYCDTDDLIFKEGESDADRIGHFSFLKFKDHEFKTLNIVVWQTLTDDFIKEMSDESYEMNYQVIDKIKNDSTIVVSGNDLVLTPDLVTSAISHWMDDLGLDKQNINVVGKNFSNFDYHFLKRLPGFGDTFKFNYRVLDPSIFYVDWVNDEELPSLQTCFHRSTLYRKLVDHKAVDDAMNTLALILEKM